jgi:hypothetical protein
MTFNHSNLCQFKKVTEIAIFVQQGLETPKAATKGMTISLPLEAREMFAEALNFQKLLW